MIDNVNNISFGAKVTLTKNPEKICPQSVRERLTPHVLNSVKTKTKKYSGFMELSEPSVDYLVAKYKGAKFCIPKGSLIDADDKTIITAFVKIIKYLETKAKFNKIKKPTKKDFITLDKRFNKTITNNTLFSNLYRIKGIRTNAREIEQNSLMMREITNRHAKLCREIRG